MVIVSSCPTLATPWTVACQAPLSMGFSRQEFLSGLPFPSPEKLPNPGIKPGFPALQADSLPTELQGKPIASRQLYIKKKKTFRRFSHSPMVKTHKSHGAFTAVGLSSSSR